MFAYIKHIVGQILIDIGKRLVASSQEIPVEPYVTYSYGPENHKARYRW